MSVTAQTLPLHCLLDTNVLGRLLNPQDAQHKLVLDAVTAPTGVGYTLFIVPQNLYELWGVATRPAESNGLGKSVADAALLLREAVVVAQLLHDTASVYEEWLRLVTQYQVRGKQVHDTRIVAAMKAHRITHLLTLNPSDFSRFASEITVVEPTSLTPAP